MRQSMRRRIGLWLLPRMQSGPFRLATAMAKIILPKKYVRQLWMRQKDVVARLRARQFDGRPLELLNLVRNGQLRDLWGEITGLKFIDLETVHSPLSSDRIFLVYGNHGLYPAHMEDFFKYYWYAIEAAGYSCSFSPKIQIGATNILIEHFLDEHVDAIAVAYELGTKFIVVACEFLTGDTFNNFVDPDAQSVGGAYENHKYFKERFDLFDKVSHCFSKLWVSTALQTEEYTERYGAERVSYIPYGYVKGFAFDYSSYPEDHRIYDCIFTGHINPHRRKMIERLQAEGLIVFGLHNETPEYIRMNHLKQSRVVLHLKQNQKWKIPSVLRYAHALMNGGYVISERCETRSELDSYVDLVETTELAKHIKQVIESRAYLSEPMRRLERFAKEFPGERFVADSLGSLGLQPKFDHAPKSLAVFLRADG